MYYAGCYPFEFISEVQMYVRPTVNPKLTDFCKSLTAISQSQVDRGCCLRETLQLYDKWLQRNHLIDPTDSSSSRKGCDYHADASGGNLTKMNDIPKATGTNPSPTFCIVTWGDSDIGTVLKEQCRRLGVELPSYFHQWINLKSLFKQHYGWEPHGGLQKVVEKCGFSFDGRAHSGLVDSRNTAKIVKRMLEEGFRFTKATRNIHAYRPRP